MIWHPCATAGKGRQATKSFTLIPFLMQLLRYCVGLDISKDSLQVCLSVIDIEGRVVVKGSTKVVNKPTAFAQLEQWVEKHRKANQLPLRYVMESTGVYHEAIAWHLYQKNESVCILLPNKAKHYLKSLGYNRAAGAVEE